MWAIQGFPKHSLTTSSELAAPATASPTLTALRQPTPRPFQQNWAEDWAVNQVRPCYIARGGSGLKIQYQRAQIPLTLVSELGNHCDPSRGICCDRGHCQQSTNSSAHPEKNQNHLFAASLVWALPLPFHFLDSCFSLIKYIFSESLTASSVEHKESHSKAHISLDQRQKLPWFSPG